MIELFLIAWTIWSIKNLKKKMEKIELLQDKVDLLYREREQDFLKMQQMQRKIDKLENINNDPQ